MSPPSLLSALAQHTTVDLDCNDEEIAALYPAGTFTHSTSNQALNFFELLKPHHQHIPAEAVEEAQQLVETGVEGAKGRDIAAVAVDIMAVKLSLLVLPSISDLVLTQTLPSAAYSTTATVTHGRALVALHAHYGIPSWRVCLKIPSTSAGLRAAVILGAEGLNTLGTIVFCEAQALAAGEAGCAFISPYLNELEVHFDVGAYERLGNDKKGPHGLDGYRVSAVAQKTYRARKQRTQVMGASIHTLLEAVCLAGLAHSTLPPSILALLSSSPVTPTFSALITQSLAFYDSALPSTLPPQLGTEGSAEPSPLELALAEPKVAALLKSALEIFGGFEMQLMGLAREALRKAGEGGGRD